MKRQGNLLVVSGPSGSGKSSLCRELLKRNPRLGLAVSHTTRKIRPGEVDGEDYCFLERAEFEKGILEGAYLEYAEVHGNFYGTPLKEVERLNARGVDVILEIDVQGGLQVREKLSDVILIFVVPPTFPILEERLRGRATDSEEVIQKRIQNALGEIAKIPRYDFLLVNDEFEDAVRDLGKIISSERKRVSHLNLEEVFSSIQIPLK